MSKRRSWWDEVDRGRLVRLCAFLSGNREAAEDLAQETLLEAWRNAHKLHDPSGSDRWLSAIARNVCRRAVRRSGREAVLVGLEERGVVQPHEEPLESEQIEALEPALGALPPTTRNILVQRYVEGAPRSEIAAQLGISEDALSMRLSRGRAALRRVLQQEFSDDHWQETRLWCPHCGRSKLSMRLHGAPGTISFRCPGCNPGMEVPEAEFPLDNPLFARLLSGLVRPARMLSRVAAWTADYYFSALETGHAACTRCGGPARLGRYSRESQLASRRHRLGLHVACETCGEQVSSSLEGLALSLPELRAFRRRHPRIRGLPRRDVELGGVPALVVRFESARSAARAEVVFARDSFRVLEIRAA